MFYMKIILTFCLLLLTLTVTQAQIPGKVLDAETNAPLQGTRIYNLETNQVQITDDSGRFMLPSEGEYRFQRKNKIQFGFHYPFAIHQLKIFKKKFGKRKFKNSEKIAKQGISIPIDPNLKKSEIIKNCKVINSFSLILLMKKIKKNLSNLFKR